MNTNSDRHLAQLFFESKLSCDSADQFAQCRPAFEAITLGYQDADDLKEALNLDGDAYYEKGIASLLLGLKSLDSGNETWGYIKLYYSSFFFQKRKLARDGVALLNCKGTMYSIRADAAASPQKHSGRTYSNDHRAAASIFINLYKDSDILLSQLIEGEETLRWLFHRRNWLNYQRRLFIDGQGDWALSSIQQAYDKQVELYCGDETPIYCFIPEFASLALPLKMAMNAISEEGGLASLGWYLDEFPEIDCPSARALELSM